MVKLLVGPIIGHVTSNSAIILFEVDEDCSPLECKLMQVDSENNAISQNNVILKEDFKAEVPKTLNFKGLKQCSRYQITVPAVSDEILGILRTFPEDIKQIKIAAVSCDNIGSEIGKYDMWKIMWERLSSGVDEIDILLHMGDNVYVDSGVASMSKEDVIDGDTSDIFNPSVSNQSAHYIIARKELKGLAKTDWMTKYDKILNLYRGLYRDTFGREYVRKVMANVSNLMILDDHEVRDDFGSASEDSNPESKEYFLGSIALKVYHEYQRALWDPEASEKPSDAFENEFYVQQFGPVGIAMLDMRTATAMGYNESKRAIGDTSLLGLQQYQSLHKNIKARQDVKCWLVISPMPLIFLTERINEAIASLSEKADDFRDFINMGHKLELESLWTLFREWKASDQSREVITLGGDVHLGGFTDIFYQSKDDVQPTLVCRQVTSSAIRNANPRKLVKMALVSTLLKITEKIGDYSYKHYDWVIDNNYAVLSFESFDPKPVYKIKLCHGDEVVEKDSAKECWDSIFRDNNRLTCYSKSCVCTIV